MRGFDIPQEQLEAGREAEEERLRKQEFISWVHKFRAATKAPPVSDEVAGMAFYMMERFLNNWTSGAKR